MSNKQYNLTWARIGNASGFRLSASFFKDNPQFKEAKGAVEVINPDTLLVRLQPQSLEQEEDELMLSLFLDYFSAHLQPNHFKCMKMDLKKMVYALSIKTTEIHVD